VFWSDMALLPGVLLLRTGLSTHRQLGGERNVP
jgi:hypothetical protein